MPPPDQARRDVLISKALSYLLRHGAVKEKLAIDDQGYVKISDILSHQRLKSFKTTREDLDRIVRDNDKKRFTIKDDMICANQGHSLKTVNNDNLTPMTLDELTTLKIYHGTYKNKLPTIKSSGGLSKMNRNHIHFTCEEYATGSGIRYNANVLVYVDAAKCTAAGIQFYKSLNNVILSPGDTNGKIPWGFVDKVVDLEGKQVDV
ncbi:tRNA 2'-phosphotransferase [Candida viswanathii]|uniref:2'-phosphotransferase n=1 Tax=Candida viswanathii TaxID=5486 RepID=A0A367YPD5_9ASCO|nr:tRNA 2'-phosphotransferase [Candida viswanathii]